MLFQAEKEAREAEKTKDELGLGGEDDLKALIQVRLFVSVEDKLPAYNCVFPEHLRILHPCNSSEFLRLKPDLNVNYLCT